MEDHPIATVLVAVIALVVVGLGLTWAIQGNNFALYQYFAPKQEQVRREVFEQTKSYNQGMVQELQNMQLSYVQADAAHKAALASIILHRAADYPEESMPTDLKQFVHKLKQDQGLAQ